MLKAGRRYLVELLLKQPVVAYDADLATEFAAAVSLREYTSGASLIVQGGNDNDLCLILVGQVAVEIHGREVALRHAGQHVGEMATIDPSERRSATIRAKEPTVAAWIGEPAFATLAMRHPSMWRRLAVELASRLRERALHVRPKNSCPVILIGSSAERLSVARAIQTAFAYDGWVVRVWTDGVFVAGRTPIESLVAQLDELDYGLFVVTRDDIVVSRDQSLAGPRDNVIFELGLLIGALGRDRTLMVRLRDEQDLKVPSDLFGVKALEVAPGNEADLASRVGPAVDEFRRIIKRLGCR